MGRGDLPAASRRGACHRDSPAGRERRPAANYRLSSEKHKGPDLLSGRDVQREPLCSGGRGHSHEAAAEHHRKHGEGASHHQPRTGGKPRTNRPYGRSDAYVRPNRRNPGGRGGLPGEGLPRHRFGPHLYHVHLRFHGCAKGRHHSTPGHHRLCRMAGGNLSV